MKFIVIIALALLGTACSSTGNDLSSNQTASSSQATSSKSAYTVTTRRPYKNCGSRPEMPVFSCASKTESSEMALGYCGSKILGCSAAEFALKLFDPLGISRLAGDACEAASDKILGLEYDVNNFLTDVGFTGSEMYMLLMGHPFVAAGIAGVSKVVDFYDCQSQVTSVCELRYSQWQKQHNKYQQCMSS